MRVDPERYKVISRYALRFCIGLVEFSTLVGEEFGEAVGGWFGEAIATVFVEEFVESFDKAPFGS